MAKQETPEAEYAHGKIVERTVEAEMKTSYLDYAMSVIVGRALPDVRDGLKPVHRRILYAMYELSNTHEKPYKKSARVVGECFVKGTLVLTEKGLMPIELVEKGDRVYTQSGQKKVHELYEMPKKELLKVTLENGIQVTVTPSQKLKTLGSGLKFIWKEAKELGKNDYVAIKSEYPKIEECVKLGEFEGRKIQLNENIAYLIGQLVSDGWVEKGGRRGYPFRCGFCSCSKKVVARIAAVLKEEFGHVASMENRKYACQTNEGSATQKNIYSVRINSSALNEFLVSVFSLEKSYAHTKEIPAHIFASPKNIIYAFLSGLIDGDGSIHVGRNTIMYGSVSEKLVAKLQVLLLHIGIMSKVSVGKTVGKRKLNGHIIKSNYPFRALEINGRFAQSLAKKLKLYNEDKRTRNSRIKAASLKQSGFDAIPYASSAIFSELSKAHMGGGWYADDKGKKFRAGIKYPNGIKIKYSKDLFSKKLGRLQIIEWGIAKKLRSIGSPLAGFVEGVIANNTYFLKVAKVEKAKPEKTYDLEIDGEHEFVANGIVSHNCLGKYHPHGDVAIYDSLVRMAQEFSMRHMLVDGQGNFGSVDGDNAAAMRYTEVRMSKMAGDMLEDIEKQTVDFAPNFDATLKEPLVLPCAVPNLLVNGSSGIAVGMATNIPPHNLGEVVDALVLMIDSPNATLQQLMEKIKGPDFPTGGIICGTSGILSAYATGRGSVRIRAKTEILQSKKDKSRKKIIITEIPYQVNKAELVKKIAELVREKVVEGISDIADRSDRTGIEVEIELKRDANAEVVLNQLYAHTPLENAFGIINLALVNNEPKVMPLADMLREFINHRRTVVRRRCGFELSQAQERKHVLDGFKAALGRIDDVVKMLKAAANAPAAKDALVSMLSIDVKQAEAILELKLGRLTALEQGKIESEHAELSKRIEWLAAVLADEAKVFAIVKEELLEIRKKYANERRTKIEQGGEEGLELEDLVPDEKAVVIITKSDYVKRVGLEEYRVQGRGGKGVLGTEMKEEDEVKDVLVCNTHDYLLCFTHQGTVHWLKVYKIPQTGRYAMGRPIVNLLNVKEERLAAAIPVREFGEGENLVMCTKKGVVKKSSLVDYSRPRQGGIIAITLREKDELIEVRKTDGKRNIIIGTKDGYAIRFEEEDVREIGRTGQGVRGIDLREGDEVIGMALDDVKTLLTVCENGYGKRTELEEYRVQGRGGMGVINIQADERNGKVVALRAVEDDDELILLSNMGKAIRIPAAGISVVGRNTKGVRLMRMQENEKVVALAVVKKEPDGNGNKAEKKEDAPAS